MKNFFFDTAEPDLNFDRDKAIYIGDISHGERNSKNDQEQSAENICGM